MNKKIVLGLTLSLAMLSTVAEAGKRKKKPPLPVESYKITKTEPFKAGSLKDREQIQGQDYTSITITDEVKCAGVAPIGVNIGRSTPQSHASKLRSVMNFEGTMYRSCAKIMKNEDGRFIVMGSGGAANGILEIYKGATLTILTGKHKGEKATIKSLKQVSEFYPAWGKKVGGYELELNKEFPNANPMIKSKEAKEKKKKGKKKTPDGVLIENLNLQNIGHLPPSGWWSKGITIYQENRPGGTGKVSGLFTATDGKKGFAYAKIGGTPRNYTKGETIVKFWAKKIEGNSKIKIVFSKGIEQVVTPTSKWEQYTIKQDAEKFTTPTFDLQVVGAGKVLLDEIAVYVGGDENPGPFRDDYIKFLKEDLNIGIIRVLQMGGNSIENMLRPRTEGTRFASSPFYFSDDWKKSKVGKTDGSYSFHEFCVLSEQIKIDPWYCIPGTLHVKEMDLLMEYLGGPAGTKGGDMRIALGHPKPWTETLRQINIEYGNEQWNIFAPYLWGGFGAGDYWNDLTARAKKSPYFNEKIIFHAGSQNWSAPQASNHCETNPDMDRVTVAPYIWHKYHNWQDYLVETKQTDIFKMGYGYSLDIIACKMGKVNDELVKGGMEGMSVYEFNYHMSQGSGPLYNRYKFAKSLGGAINIMNSVLYMQKEFRAKEQCLFILGGGKETASYYGNGKLWPGWNLTYFDKEKDAFVLEPIGIGLSLINKAIFAGAESLKTTHKGEEPRFETIGHMPSIYTDVKKGEIAKLTDIPSLWSYAFRKDNKRSIVLINMDTEKDRTMQINFKGSAKNVESWIMTDDKIDASTHNRGAATEALRHEFLYSIGSLQPNSKEWKAKYTNEYLSSKKAHVLALEMFNDSFIPVKTEGRLWKTIIEETAKKWIAEEAKDIKTIEEFKQSIKNELETAKYSSKIERCSSDVKKHFFNWVDKHSKEHKPTLKAEKTNIENFKSGSKIVVPKHSMQMIRWEE